MVLKTGRQIFKRNALRQFQEEGPPVNHRLLCYNYRLLDFQIVSIIDLSISRLFSDSTTDPKLSQLNNQPSQYTQSRSTRAPPHH